MAFRRKMRVKSITGDYTVLPSDNETVFVAASGADIEFTLPAVADSKECSFRFVNGQDFEMLITAPDETLVAFNDATADGISVTGAGEHLGGVFELFCDGSLWYAMGLHAGANTVTVISA